ncbi:MAG: type I DNA topoisomerase, partial [Actinobacteria bacterium]|nr:type I DNA topoisomerase [Actinomycetota bacterium]
MPKPLIIVESPAKARTISRFLGKRYQVLPSMGHVRDLPKSQFGVDVEHGFQPKYITIRGKGQVVRELREAAKKSEQVYLATDPDREGEAISWHLAEVLGLSDKQVKRIEFHEITKDAVARAIKHWRPLSYGLVDAQQARRVLDRIVGYQLSPWLWRKVRPGLSAGRVQSTALRLLVERQAEIDAFVPEEYFTLTASLSGGGTALSADYLSPLGERGRLSRTELDTVVAEVGPDVVPRPPFRIADVKERERRRYAPFAFTTSTLQQEASKRLGLTVKRAMQLAQQLYEGLEVQGEGTVGLITYIRTDSTRVAESAEEEGRQYIREVYGLEYESRERRRAPSRPGQQGAHEAIRPTVVRRTPDSLKRSLSRDQLRLYRLIWERFVASQMAPAVYDTVTVDVAAGRHTFRSRMQKLKFPGFTALYDEPDEDAATGQPLTVPLRVGEALNVEDLKSEQHFTEPPPRYTEASLVKALEDLGIGRPSTYAPTIETLLARDYARREERRLVPTELGRAVVDLLKEFFPRIVDIQFTAAMEADLDRVEEGQESWRALLQSFYDDFSGYLVRAEKEAGPVHIAEE